MPTAAQSNNAAKGADQTGQDRLFIPALAMRNAIEKSGFRRTGPGNVVDPLGEIW